MAESTRDGGLLPAWQVKELPSPPPFSLRNAIIVIGPGAIALSTAIGGGEWLQGPALVVRHDFSLLWIATVAIFLQLMLNLAFLRYTLYTGEPVVNGFMRLTPGPWFWALVYIVLALLHVGWALGAAGSASSIFSALYGHVPGKGDQAAIRIIGYLTFVLSFLIVAFGGKVERMLEWVNWFMVIFIIGFLLIIDILFVPPRIWWEGLVGHFQFGSLPKGVDWMLLASFAAFAGMGGIGNVWTSNWIRDKGFGMGSVVGYIPSLVGGKVVKVSPTGSVFAINSENMSRWRQWWKYTYADQAVVWAFGCFLGVYLNAILAKAIIPAGTDMTTLAAGAYQAKYLALEAGRFLWFLTLLTGFWIFFGSQISILDGFCRLSTDILWGASERLRNRAKGDIRRVYYTLLVLFALWGCVAINLAQPFALFKISGNVAAFILAFAGVHVLILNSKFLPAELRGPKWQGAGLILAILFYAFFFVAGIGRWIKLW